MVKSYNLSDVSHQQTALNNITNVSDATNEYILTKDTTTGNAIFKAGIAFETVTNNIQMDGTAFVGNTGLIPHSNHVHPTDTSRQAAITGGASTITANNLTTNRALVSDENGKVVATNITSTELGYLAGVSSNVQSQINANASFKYGLYTLSADQTSNTGEGSHVEFNTSEGSLGGLATGSGQANGIITIPAGKKYKITGSFRFGHSAAGWTEARVYDRTNSIYISGKAVCYSTSCTSTNYSTQPSFLFFITPASDIVIDVRFHILNTNRVVALGSYLLIEEYAGS